MSERVVTRAMARKASMRAPSALQKRKRTSEQSQLQSLHHQPPARDDDCGNDDEEEEESDIRSDIQCAALWSGPTLAGALAECRAGETGRSCEWASFSFSSSSFLIPHPRSECSARPCTAGKSLHTLWVRTRLRCSP